MTAFLDKPAESLTKGVATRLVDDMPAGSALVFISRMRTIYAWAVQREMVAANPFIGIKPPKVGEYRPWSADELDAFISCPDSQVRMACMLGLYTAQRMGDVLKMRWADIHGEAIYVKQQKTGVELYLPIHPKLRQALDAHPKRGETIVAMSSGERYPTDSFRRKFSRERGSLKLSSELTFHGLRKTMACMLASKGATTQEIMKVGGWQNSRMVDHYCKGADQFRLAQAAFKRLVA